LPAFDHDYPFDPSYGYSLDELLAVVPPAEPVDFAAFWQERYSRTLALEPRPKLLHVGSDTRYEIFDLSYASGGGFNIRGWAAVPRSQTVSQVLVVGHGYGGREAPDLRFEVPKTAFLFPCFRGLSRSRKSPISTQPHYHVLHDLDHRDRYIIGGCVEDLWLAVTAAQVLFPAAARIGYMGSSLGGGIGALAAPWDNRLRRLHLHVPTFGHQALRLTLPTTGSGAAVQIFARYHRHVADTLAYYDAAIASRFAYQPVHVAAATFDPMVAPPGQFAVYNAWAGPKSLMVLDGGHFDYPGQKSQEQAMVHEVNAFFSAGVD